METQHHNHREGASPFSFHSITRDEDISVRTAIEHVKALKGMFALLDVPYMGLDGKCHKRESS